MVEFRDDLLTNNKVVVNCRTEEQADNLAKWLNRKNKSYVDIARNWRELQAETCYNTYNGKYCDKAWYVEQGKTILTYEEALKPVDKVPESITRELSTLKEDKYEGTIITNYDANTGIEQIIKIPMDANLDEMAYIFSMFLKSVGYSPIAGVTIQREGMSDITSDDLYN